jgi:hypothetical protein
MADKYLREIEEILEGVESKAHPKSKLSKGEIGTLEPQGRISKGFAIRTREFIKITPGRLILLGILVLVVAIILNFVISEWIALFVWLGLVLLVAAYVLIFIKRDGSSKHQLTGSDKSRLR